MPVIGIDLGSDNCVISLARKGGIDVVVNEFSRRYSPNIVAFTDKERNIGESGLSQVTFSPQNTVPAIKRLIGLTYSQAEAEGELKNYACKVTQGPNDSILLEVTYLGEKRQFTPIQILAMTFGKLIDYVEKECGIRAMDCVIAIPGYFTDIQRRHVLQAAEVAGIHCIRLINDTTAAALEYGIYKELEETPVNIAFVDVGHGDTTVSVVQLSKGNLKVVASAFERHLGAGHFEDVLVQHFAKQIQEKYKIDPLSNPKGNSRLRKECERLKKVLSANPQAIMRVESIMNDIDVQFNFTREEFEKLSEDLLKRFEVPVQKALTDSKLQLSDLHSVELIGGGSYIPSLKNIISTIFQKNVSTTLNSMESIARGSAIQAAMISPSFHLARQITVTEAVPYPVSVGWVANPSSKDSMDTASDEVVETGNQVINKTSPMFKQYEGTPASKILTFPRNKDFELFALYTDVESLPPKTNNLIGKFTVVGVPEKNSTGGPTKVKVKVRHNLHGIFQVEEAHTVEEVEVDVEEEVPEEEEKKDEKTDKKDDKKEKKKQTRVVKRKKTITHKLQVKEEIAGLASAETIKKYIEEEKKMANADRSVRETAEAKNDVESYIYAMRDRIIDGGDLYAYIDPKGRQDLNQLLDDTENWLYGEGEEATKDQSKEKLWALKKQGDAAEIRIREEAGRPAAVDSVLIAIEEYKQFIQSQEEKYAHIAQSEKDKVAEKVTETQQWLKGEQEKQSKLAKHDNPSLTIAALQTKEKELRNLAKPIVSTPVPKKEEPKPEEKKPETTEAKPEEPKQEEKKADDTMDLNVD